MHRRLITETGSVYELKSDEKLIRRVQGAAPPTPRQGANGDWKPYESIAYRIGVSIFIIWSYDGPIARSTRTSTLISIEEIPA